MAVKALEVMSCLEAFWKSNPQSLESLISSIQNQMGVAMTREDVLKALAGEVAMGLLLRNQNAILTEVRRLWRTGSKKESIPQSTIHQGPRDDAADRIPLSTSTSIRRRGFATRANSMKSARV